LALNNRVNQTARAAAALLCFETDGRVEKGPVVRVVAGVRDNRHGLLRLMAIEMVAWSDVPSALHFGFLWTIPYGSALAFGQYLFQFSTVTGSSLPWAPG